MKHVKGQVLFLAYPSFIKALNHKSIFAFGFATITVFVLQEKAG